MKTSCTTSLLAFLSAISTATARPAQTLNTSNTLQAHQILGRAVCSREADNVVSDVVAATGSGQSIQVYTAGAGGGALSVCVLLSNHGVGQLSDCAPIAGIIAAATAVIYSLVQNSNSGTKTAGKRDESSLVSLLNEHYDFESIDAMPLTKRAHHGNTTRFMDERFSIKGLKHFHHSADVILTTYTDGTGHIFTQPTPLNATALTKRHDGPGFKINYRTIKFAGGLGGAPTFPSLNAQLAGGIAQDWAARANNDGIDEYFATTGITNPKLETIGLRIISENNGFGEEYESVDVCGKLGSSHDEL